MLVQQFPKPKHKKKKPLYNHRPTVEDVCIYTSEPFACTHEVFFGRGQRQLSIKYGMQVKVSSRIHQSIHANPLTGMDLELKRKHQLIFERKHGHVRFMQLFGRDYLNIDSAASFLEA
jgi:hypothetical protein